MNYLQIFKESVQKYGNRNAICQGQSEKLTYSELDFQSSRLSGKIHAMGLEKGSFILIKMKRSPLFAVAFIGILKSGCVAVPVVPEYPETRIKFISDNCNSKLTITDDFLSDISEYECFENPADGCQGALLLNTSGSTGTPKGILHSTADLARMCLRLKRFFEDIDKVNYAATASFAFIATVVEYLTVFSVGGCTHVLPDNVRKSITEIEKYISDNDITIIILQPQMLRLFPAKCQNLKRVLTGSERVTGVYSGNYQIINLYGASEVCLVSSFTIDKKYSNTPIGKALDGVEIILDNGEICIRTESDTVYFKDSEKTDKCFVKEENGMTLYHTGDMGHINEDGNLVFDNRVDWMVKINGQRVDTLEIESVLSALPEIDQSVVKAFEDSNNQTYLVAYYTLKMALDNERVISELRNRLPEYMIPRYCIKLDEFAKNTNGKVDRLALKAPSADYFKKRFEEPQNREEQKICEAFDKVLNCGRIGRKDDFFTLGGDSIKVLQLLEILDNGRITVESVLKNRTPENIAKAFQKEKPEQVKHCEMISGTVPLTISQKGVYLDCISEPESVKYNIPFVCSLPGNTDIPHFEECVKTVCSKHISFNVNVKTINGIPSMVSTEKTVEINHFTTVDIKQFCRDFVKPFNPENGNLFRFAICTCAENKYFVFDVHHIVFDGSSVKIFLDEIAACYNGIEPSEEKLTLFDIAKNEENLKTTERYKKAQDYFKGYLADSEFDSKPVSDVLQKTENSEAGIITVSTDAAVDNQVIKAFTRKAGITENTLFMSAFSYALAKYTNSKSSFFCTADNGRRNAKLSSSIGMFVKTLPVFCMIDDKKEIKDFLNEMQTSFFETMENACIDFEELAEKYKVNTDIVFVYQSDLLNGSQINCGTIKAEAVETKDIQSDLSIMVLNKEKHYSIEVRFRKNVYTFELASSLVKMFMNVIKGMIKCRTLGDIQLTDNDDRLLIERINRTEVSYDKNETIVGLFRKQVEKTPDAICLVYKDEKYTYKQLDRITDLLAAYLVEEGIKKETVTGILIHRSSFMLICSLAVLKAGGAYMPIDPSYPDDRINLMIKDSNAILLIADDDLCSRINNTFKGKRILTSDIGKLEYSDICLPNPKPEDLFILLYTSGSTGLPKGVMFEHSNALVTAQWVRKYYKMDSTSNVVSYASYGFDANVFDMYPPIISGGCLHIISEDIRLDFYALRNYFNINNITHAVMTTQVGRQFALLGGLKTLKHLSVAGEKLTPFEIPSDYSVYNLYGPTEGSVVTSAFRIEGNYSDIPIGYAVDNLKIYTVDSEKRLLPMGATGELWISGPHVTRGYLNRPEKNAQSYILNPFSSEKGYERVYRTGDVVRILFNGNMQFIGRKDNQVKIRGFRVELTEIEETIRRFKGVKDATVTAFDDPSGGKFIAAYVVSDSKIDVEKLNEFIKSDKPSYMVPAVTMQIDRIPLNQNQKVNRKALPIPERKLNDITAPENGIQQRIFDTVASVLGHRGFGIDSDFYDAGLTSIGTLKLNVDIAKEFDIVLRISDLKNSCTVRKLEAFINKAKPEKAFETLSDYPLTNSQNGIFIECMAAPGTTIYNMPLLLKLSDKLDIDKLAESLEKTIDAHPYLKTVLFTDDGGNVRAKRNDNEKAIVSVLKCKQIPEPENLVKPFTLLNSPLYRTTVYKTDKGNYLFLDVHHIICDGESERILFEDLDSVYNGKTVEKEVFTGFEKAIEEQNRDSGKSKEYYKALLSSCETDCLPKKDGQQSCNKAGNIRQSGLEDAKDIIDFCNLNNVTLNAFFNSVFAYVIGRYTNKDNLTHATVFNGRNDSRSSRSVSLFVRTVPVVGNLKYDLKTSQFIRKMQNQLMDSMRYDDVSFPQLVSTYSVNADMIIVYQGDSMTFDNVCGEKAQISDLPLNAAKAPVSLTVFLNGNHFDYNIEYREDYYSKEFASSLLDAFVNTSINFTADCSLADVSMLSDKSEKVYGKLNDTDTEKQTLLCYEMFEKYAIDQSDSPALIAQGKKFSFRQINDNANRIAHALIKSGIIRESIVGIILGRNENAIEAEIGIMKAGGAFLPMLESYPDDRIEYCLTDADSDFVITTSEHKASHPALFADNKPYKTLTVEELLSENNTSNPHCDVGMNNLAYCIYTSGSTGNPKGVLIEHHSLSNFIRAFFKDAEFYLNKDDNSSFAGISSLSFDMSIGEIYSPLCHGRCFCMASEEETHNPLELIKLCIENNVRLLLATPSFMSSMIGYDEFAPVLKNLQTVMLGAEAFPKSLYDRMKEISPSLQIFNGYGPTETAICCSEKILNATSSITIGKPLENVRMFVVDKHLNVLPPFASGELIICGEAVGRGYRNLEEKTKASFFMLRNMPAYHSGDLVRLTSDAEIDFQGRIDNQVKLRGFRIELDEIEKVICSFAGVKQSKVIVRNNKTEDYLAGFFTAEVPVEIDKIKEHLKAHLTYYMVPSVLMQIEKMPLTPNGKIDKKALPETIHAKQEKKTKRQPKKSLEQRLCEIYAKVLNIEEVYVNDNFFELGGTSLSASKVTMLLMSEGLDVKYGDIFDHPAPEDLASFIENRKITEKKEAVRTEAEDKTRPALKYNCVKYSKDVTRTELGDILLTGATGFLGIHILNELLESEKGHIYCLVRKGQYQNCETRLKTMLIYYGFHGVINSRITTIDADITDKNLSETLESIHFDTVFNCAACVKHFSDSDVLDRINVHGVENLIKICTERNAKLIQVSTVSVPGIHTEESFSANIKMHENELFVIDDMDNKYGISKFKAEKAMFDAIEKGMRGKVLRAGNLMGRFSDGEFQANFETNMFMRGIRGFAIMGKYPISHMTDPMKFSPVDYTAKAMVLLAGTDDKFTAFNVDNRYGFDEMKIIDACNRNGITIHPEQDDIYYEEFNKKLADEKINEKLNGLAAYDIKDAHAVETDNLFTTNILYRIGFSWPLVDDSYLDKAIDSLKSLEFFSQESEND